MTFFLHWFSDGGCSRLIGDSISLGFTLSPSPVSVTWLTNGTRLGGLDLVAPPQTRSATAQVFSVSKVYVDDVTVQRQAACTSGNCLNKNRFAVDVRWSVNGHSGFGTPVTLTPDSEFFWFFGPDNVELVVKVLNGCPVNGHYWVFVGGLTNVGVEVTVTDVASGATQTYKNLEGQAFQPIQDTSAFATCP
jgi:hypothetical protein